VNRRRGALVRAGGLVVIGLGVGMVALAGAPEAMSDASSSPRSVFVLFGGVILIAGGIRLLVGPEKLNQLLKPQRHRRR
jgi:peptidoglycan/LPS O-acetylase OafA/YrhL